MFSIQSLASYITILAIANTVAIASIVAIAPGILLYIIINYNT